MKILDKLAHIFVPQESNNQKARILHPVGLLVLSLGLIFYQAALLTLPNFGLKVLGYAANISPEEIIRLTNEKRIGVGLAPLTQNSFLSSAAQAKAADMLVRDYWAHVGPDETQPWKFFVDAGYKYRYAGENLARDFGNPKDALEAWMASSSHRENLLSPKYKEIGVAVVEGDLGGVETTIIVQFFGTQYLEIAELEQISPGSRISPEALSSSNVPVAPQLPKISPFTSTKSLSMLMVVILLGVLLVDGIITWQRKITRVSGRTLAHIAFLGMILSIVIILKAGRII